MRALTVILGAAGSLALSDIDEPSATDGSVLVESLAVGICGTDSEIAHGSYGEAPAAEHHLVIGHENLGRVLEAPADAAVSVGDLVVGIVRRPDPEPCAACAIGEWDMCRNGRYVEHGIKGLHGFARERWRGEPKSMVVLDQGLTNTGVLLEPATVVAKAWEQIDRISSRAYFPAKPVVAITGAGPIGLLAALLSVQRGHHTHVFDIVTDGIKPELVHQLGAEFHSESLTESKLHPDVVVECTGVSSVVMQAVIEGGHNAIICLTGVSDAGRTVAVDVGATNRELVLQNNVVFGSVNANRRHYELAVSALVDADYRWLKRLITRRVPLEDFRSAFAKQDNDVKVVLDIGADQ